MSPILRLEVAYLCGLPLSSNQPRQKETSWSNFTRMARGVSNWHNIHHVMVRSQLYFHGVVWLKPPFILRPTGYNILKLNFPPDFRNMQKEIQVVGVPNLLLLSTLVGRYVSIFCGVAIHSFMILDSFGSPPCWDKTSPRFGTYHSAGHHAGHIRKVNDPPTATCGCTLNFRLCIALITMICNV